MPVIGIAGMTHLGLVTGSAIASKGFTTICYDGDGSRIATLARGELTVSEPGLDALIAGNGDRQRFTADIAALAPCDIVYIARDVPTAATGESDLASISQLIAAVSGVLNPQALLVVLSQVPPGFMRSLTVLAQTRLYYQVETLIFGRAVTQATEPERFIVGCADPDRPLDARLTTLYQAFGCPVIPMRFESAELAKIAINMFLVSSISLTNLMAELCEHVGADWGEIVPALKLDRRIGPHAYLAPGLGIAGGNLERDLASVERLAAAKGVDAGLIDVLARDQRTKARLGCANDPRAAARRPAGCHARDLGARLQGKHGFGQEFAGVGDDRAARHGAPAFARSRGARVGGRRLARRKRWRSARCRARR